MRLLGWAVVRGIKQNIRLKRGEFIDLETCDSEFNVLVRTTGLGPNTSQG